MSRFYRLYQADFERVQYIISKHTISKEYTSFVNMNPINICTRFSVVKRKFQKILQKHVDFFSWNWLYLYLQWAANLENRESGQFQVTVVFVYIKSRWLLVQVIKISWLLWGKLLYLHIEISLPSISMKKKIYYMLYIFSRRKFLCSKKLNKNVGNKQILWNLIDLL